MKGTSRPVSDVTGKDRIVTRDSRNKNTDMKGPSGSGKEESPIARDELSLATLFAQTETAPIKKKPTKSFGGKKSPKKTLEDTKSIEKAKPGLIGRMAGRGRRVADRKDLLALSGEAAAEKEAEKDRGKASGRKGEGVK